MERQSEESFCWVGLITVGATCIYLGERRGGGGRGVWGAAAAMFCWIYWRESEGRSESEVGIPRGVNRLSHHLSLIQY